jgi:hypothetical protein
MPKSQIIVYKFGGSKHDERYPEQFGLKTSPSQSASYHYFKSRQEVIDCIVRMPLEILRRIPDYDPNLPKEDRVAFEEARTKRISALEKR